MEIEVGCDEVVTQFVSNGMGSALGDAFRTIGVWSGNRLVSGVHFADYTGVGIEMSGAGRLMFQRSVVQVICDLVYGYLGCRRLQVVCRRSNKRMRKITLKLGFVYEGRLRLVYGDEDGFVYSLLSNEAIAAGHWTPRVESPHGQSSKAA